ncbi:MAG: prolipoprotein diacylglyceryl transferase [Candidatus Cardinium sp.]|uniref:prolipoprotein diacylglyceryl transferase n=1 Tax=Candidatus Cardinium sp. TP TaxID=2961955 RepID=UPI0021AEAF86|nr:prolipoprotein diacylglyceryl transferase [Candidatus Cardinium sp. TP]MCT4697200.1 prolipoprotein diacylglyceryl transferase [Candidatus Cardinium sp. TP]
MLNTIIWDVSPEIFTKGFLNLRWYNLLFATGVLGSYSICYYMFAKAGKEHKAIEQLRNYIVISIMVGARLGHVIFYEWNYYKDHLLEIFLPVTFSPTFKITGFSGLASHGAAVGMVLAVFLYVKRIKFSISPLRIYFENRRSPGEFLWIWDRLAMLVALGGAFIRIGNFMNSEIIGKPTGSNYGVVFARELHEHLCKQHASTIQSLTIRKASMSHIPAIKAPYQPIELSIAFKETMTDEKMVKRFIEQSLKDHLIQESYFNTSPKIYETYGTPLSYTLQKENGGYKASVYTWGIPRHPAQLYESFSCILIFIILFVWLRQQGQRLAPGRIFGSLMVTVGCLRFFYEFYKENQVAFEDDMWLNMGQWLSVPWIIVGLFLVLRSATKIASKDHLK